jgi:hypothetical protein
MSQVFFKVGLCAELTGRLNDHIYGIIPWQRLDLLFCGNLDGRRTNHECGAVHMNILHIPTVYGIVLEKVSKRTGVGQIVDGNDLNLRIAITKGSKNQTSDASETIDCNT